MEVLEDPKKFIVCSFIFRIKRYNVYVIIVYDKQLFVSPIRSYRKLDGKVSYN